MASTLPRRKTAKRYPYDILPVAPPDIASLKKLDLRNVLEFLRIEALLRSDTVVQLYKTRRKGKKKGSSDESSQLYARYWFTWEVLNGTHHTYVDPARQQLWQDTLGPSLGPGLVDISGLFDGSETGVMPSPHCLYLEIDPTHPPTVILSALKPLLRERYVQWKEKPPHLQLDVWLNNLKCYDLYWSNPNLSYGQIGHQVYGEKNPKTYERAEAAIKRVTRLIDAAEHGRWPPQNP